jgi:RimJ/RimL family protein N-acetyltransferase
LQATLSAQPATNFCIDISEAAVGGIGIRLGEDVHRYRAELGYWLSEDFWGHGITSEAVPAVTDYCFANFELHRIYAEPFANNPASARVLEKASFVLEGRLRNNVVKDGQILDSLLYAKTK